MFVLQLGWLANNDLTGEVPEELSNLNLKALFLDGNQLSGNLDPIFCANPSPALNELTADCEGDTPQIFCSCCTSCGSGNANVTLSPSTNGRLSKLRDILDPISGQQAFEDNNSDQYAAMAWIANSDPSPQDLDSTDPVYIIQKYILVLLYVSTHGEHWMNQNGWKGVGSVCSWDGIGCDDSELIIKVDLGNNNLNGTLVTEIGFLGPSLQELRINGNLLHGHLPSEIGLLEKITSIDISGCQLTGFLPFEIGSLSSLIEIDLKNNMLSGPLPFKVGQLSKAEYIYIGENQFNGQIPSEIGSMTGLIVFQASNNQFSGTIPSQVSGLSNLVTWDVQKNSLSGGIPPEIGQLTLLEELYFSKFL
jgi:Leucine-rich repeat (LRR) protein